MSSYTMLSALSPQTDSNSILVRVGRVWEAINRNTNTLLHTNVILMDEQENHMLAVVRNNQKDTFFPLLKEDEVYNISNVKLVPGPKLYRTVDRDLAINFFYKTKIEKTVSTGCIPRHKFELQPFHKVKELVGNVRCLIDVVGMVTSYGKLEKRSNGAEKMDVIITNSRNEKIVVTLWETRALQFLGGLAESEATSAFVVITGLLAKKFSDNASLSSTDATRSYFNIDYAPLNKLKEEIAAATGKSVESLGPPTMRQFVNLDDQNIPEVSIKSILEVQIPTGKDLVRCVCKAKIVDILNGNGWYYTCCPKCAHSVRPIEGKYYCGSCAEEASPLTHRYRMVVRIEDDSGTTTLTLFNKEAEQLIGVPLPKILAEVKEDQDLAHIPSAIKNIIGKMCTFQIKVTSYNISHGCDEYTVTRVTESSPTTMNEGAGLVDGNLKKKQKCA